VDRFLTESAGPAQAFTDLVGWAAMMRNILDVIGVWRDSSKTRHRQYAHAGGLGPLWHIANLIRTKDVPPSGLLEGVRGAARAAAVRRLLFVTGIAPFHQIPWESPAEMFSAIKGIARARGCGGGRALCYDEVLRYDSPFDQYGVVGVRESGRGSEDFLASPVLRR